MYFFTHRKRKAFSPLSFANSMFSLIIIQEYEVYVLLFFSDNVKFLTQVRATHPHSAGWRPAEDDNQSLVPRDTVHCSNSVPKRRGGQKKCFSLKSNNRNNNELYCSYTECVRNLRIAFTHTLCFLLMANYNPNDVSLLYVWFLDNCS